MLPGRAAAPAAPPPHPPDHPPLVAAGTPAAAWVESLGHATELGAPCDVLLEALLGLLGDADPLPARLLAETGYAAGCGAFLLFGRRPDILQLRKRPEHHDLVILQGDLR